MTCFSSARHRRNRHARAPPSRRRRRLRVTMLNVPNSATFSGIVVAEVAAAALLALDRRARDRLGHGQQVLAGRSPCASRGCIRGCRRRRRARRAPSAPRAPSRASLHLALAADDADQVLHHVLQVAAGSCTGFSPAAGRARTAPAPRSVARSTWRRIDRAARCSPCANFAAYSPARLPKTSRSESELPPRRLAPLMPAAHSPAAKRPGNRRHLRVAVHRTPPIM